MDYLLTMEDDGYQYEVVEGTVVRIAGSGGETSGIAAVLTAG